jgi:hypothetical protein
LFCDYDDKAKKSNRSKRGKGIELEMAGCLQEVDGFLVEIGKRLTQTGG